MSCNTCAHVHMHRIHVYTHVLCAYVHSSITRNLLLHSHVFYSIPPFLPPPPPLFVLIDPSFGASTCQERLRRSTASWRSSPVTTWGVILRVCWTTRIRPTSCPTPSSCCRRPSTTPVSRTSQTSTGSSP